jgi:hypothetical protein
MSVPSIRNFFTVEAFYLFQLRFVSLYDAIRHLLDSCSNNPLGQPEHGNFVPTVPDFETSRRRQCCHIPSIFLMALSGLMVPPRPQT